MDKLDKIQLIRSYIGVFVLTLLFMFVYNTGSVCPAWICWPDWFNISFLLTFIVATALQVWPRPSSLKSEQNGVGIRSQR
jgi:hypothetical protein